MKLQDTKRSYYICKLLAEKEQEGINYLTIDSLFSLASSKAPNLLYEEFSKDLSVQQILGNVVIEDDICYIAFNRRHEIVLALNITNYLEDNLLDSYKAPNPVSSLLFLTDEQADAIKMALTCRLSIIAGAAGTGKTAILKDLISCYKKEKGIILFSPAHEGVSFSNAKGYKLKPLYYLEEAEDCENFLIDTGWNDPGLIIVDNADMLSLGELCGILYNAPLDCHVVLLGDNSKVSSCAEESVFTDLIGLGIPAAHLTMQHRYALGSALEKNITNFAKVLKEKDLAYDNSFEFIHCDKAKASELVVSKASELLHAGSDVQVITVFPEGDELSVKNLNNNIKFAFNPDTEGRTAIADSAISFTYNSGDRIRLTSEAHYMLGEKNYTRSILFEENMPKDSVCMISSLDGNHKQVLNKLGDTSIFEPGYAITPKKACGCEYEYVIIPVFDSPEFFLTRSELYSVITRAKERVILIGDPKALDKALRRVPKKEKRNLISRVRYLQRCYSLKS